MVSNSSMKWDSESSVFEGILSLFAHLNDHLESPKWTSIGDDSDPGDDHFCFCQMKGAQDETNKVIFEKGLEVRKMWVESSTSRLRATFLDDVKLWNESETPKSIRDFPKNDLSQNMLLPNCAKAKQWHGFLFEHWWVDFFLQRFAKVMILQSPIQRF